MQRARPTVLVVHPDPRPPGGAASVCAWTLAALQDDYAVTLLSLARVDLSAIDRSFGTALRPEAIRLERCWPLLAALLDLAPVPLSLVRNHLLYRECRARAGGYDMVVNLTNEAWLGRRSIQYVHFPWGYWPRPEIELRWYHRPPGLLRAYYALCARLSAFENERVRDNRMLANSDWTGERVRERYGVTALTVYPPVAAAPPPPAWHEREDAFLSIGRLAPEKQIETAIAIVGRLRRTRPKLRLCLAGSRSRREGAYYTRLLRLVEANADWLSLVEDADRSRLAELIARHRYGLHAMVDEHFGIAIAEMAGSGCVTFVHASGGQREIVVDPRLQYSSEDDAVAKIEVVLGDAALQQELSAGLRAGAGRFTAERFMGALRAVVQDELARA